ncbi:ATP-binding cassette domain-containing protein [Marinactinospora thermotolerans]|uniref:ABC-2 type transport system ATP-binding protein n=1 Tax=Marinactinospora thermotolerans DSM 45154 TaxID=1122192 RepID=A0A1T4P3G1_9ACTN|nr:ATP-binding cassette domain-containing protein [Marinactinospora thermotolerans]SJZ86160.1 ABC-2 type transport system ATP-binding protein [Marinactinospora thermotolerans DSM 45154]
MIHARRLSRGYRHRAKEIEAVREVDLDVAQGELVALLGPNGAGKSTLLRMLTTLLPPSAGSATVAGHDIVTDPAGVRSRIGYVGQRNAAGEEQRVHDELVLHGLWYGLSGSAARRRADEVVELLDLGEVAGRKPGTLSGGQRRRLDIAFGMVHHPPLLFLDEPSTGLDPQSRADVWRHVLRLRRERGTTIVLTTHYLDEADDMAERVIVIDHGRVIADGTAERLKDDLAGDRITVTLSDPEQGARAAGIAARIEGTGEVEIDGSDIRVRVPRADRALPRHLRELEAAGIEVSAARGHRPTLDDVFLALTGRSLEETNRQEVAA